MALFLLGKESLRWRGWYIWRESTTKNQSKMVDPKVFRTTTR